MAEELMVKMRELVASHAPTKGWNARALEVFEETLAWWTARPPSAITGRGRSENQDVGTPPEFVRVAQEVFGAIQFDLAASEVNHVHPRYLTIEHNALAANTRWPKYRPDKELIKRPHHISWLRLLHWLWLNPPYAKIEPWLARCQEEMERGRSIMVLIPASIGSRWWKKWVEDTWTEDGHGPRWLSLGRLKFVGQKQGAPRDMALLIYSQTWRPEFVQSSASAIHLHLPVNQFFQNDRPYLGNWDWRAFLAQLTGDPTN